MIRIITKIYSVLASHTPHPPRNEMSFWDRRNRQRLVEHSVPGVA